MADEVAICVRNPGKGGHADFRCQAPRSWTIRQLKQLIERDYEGHPVPGAQQIIFCGQLLRDDNLLSDAFPSDNGSSPPVVVHLVVKPGVSPSATPTSSPSPATTSSPSIAGRPAAESSSTPAVTATRLDAATAPSTSSSAVVSSSSPSAGGNATTSQPSVTETGGSSDTAKGEDGASSSNTGNPGAQTQQPNASQSSAQPSSSASQFQGFMPFAGPGEMSPAPFINPALFHQWLLVTHYQHVLTAALLQPLVIGALPNLRMPAWSSPFPPSAFQFPPSASRPSDPSSSSTDRSASAASATTTASATPVSAGAPSFQWPTAGGAPPAGATVTVPQQAPPTAVQLAHQQLLQQIARLQLEQQERMRAQLQQQQQQRGVGVGPAAQQRFVPPAQAAAAAAAAGRPGMAAAAAQGAQARAGRLPGWLAGANVDVQLLLKLALLIFFLNQDGSTGRLVLLVVGAVVVYMYQAGLLEPVRRAVTNWLHRLQQQPLGVHRHDGQPRGEGAAGQAQGADPAARPGMLRQVFNELQLLVVGFFASLIPGWQGFEDGGAPPPPVPPRAEQQQRGVQEQEFPDDPLHEQ